MAVSVILATKPDEFFVGSTQYGDLMLDEKNRKCSLERAPAIATFIDREAQTVESFDKALDLIENGNDVLYIPIVLQEEKEHAQA